MFKINPIRKMRLIRAKTRLLVVMVAAQCTRPRTRLDQQRRAAQRGKFQQFCSAKKWMIREV